jgi:hypothetical protein
MGTVDDVRMGGVTGPPIFFPQRYLGYGSAGMLELGFFLKNSLSTIASLISKTWTNTN